MHTYIKPAPLASLMQTELHLNASDECMHIHAPGSFLRHDAAKHETEPEHK
jgi:hypothetical protein